MPPVWKCCKRRHRKNPFSVIIHRDIPSIWKSLRKCPEHDCVDPSLPLRISKRKSFDWKERDLTSKNSTILPLHPLRLRVTLWHTRASSRKYRLIPFCHGSSWEKKSSCPVACGRP